MLHKMQTNDDGNHSQRNILHEAASFSTFMPLKPKPSPIEKAYLHNRLYKEGEKRAYH